MGIQKNFAKAVKDLQKLVRLRAADERGYSTCVLCGHYGHYTDMDGAHFVSRTHKNTLLDKRNVANCCWHCNRMMAGNEHKRIYRLWMLEMYGQQVVDELEDLGRKPSTWTPTSLAHEHARIKAELKIEQERVCYGA